MEMFLYLKRIRKKILNTYMEDNSFPKPDGVRRQYFHMQLVTKSDQKQESNTIHGLHNQVIQERYHLLCSAQLLVSTHQHYLDLT